MRRYPLLTDVLEGEMDELVSQGERKEATKTRVMQDVSYLLEAFLATMPIEVVEACLESHGIKGESTISTARWLKGIVDERKREA